MPRKPTAYRHLTNVHSTSPRPCLNAGGVVFYANYLKFFERARTEWLRSLGFGQEALRAETGAIFIVSETAVRYLRPARLDDLLTVTVEIQHAGQASMTVAQVAWRGDERLAEGEIRIGCVDAQSFRPRRIPDPLHQSVRHHLSQAAE